MGLKNDAWIRRMALEHRIIEPFVEMQVQQGVISFGVSSYGYDMRIANEFLVFTNVWGAVVDPKQFDERAFVKHEGESCLIPPNSFALGRSIEYFRIPRAVTAVCVGKSSYARCGIVCHVTPLEAEWEGFVTIEISNTTPLPAKIYAHEGICQVLFFEADEECQVSYADRRGKYMHQGGITLPKVFGEEKGPHATGKGNSCRST